MAKRLTLAAWPAAGAAILSGATFHARRGDARNAFTYGVDYLLLRMAPGPAPVQGRLFGWLRKLRLMAYDDRDHGVGDGQAARWAAAEACALGLPDAALAEIWLLTQPRRFGYVFNPVSFWFFRDAAGGVRAVLAEVNNTYGDRHSYFCARPDFGAIADADRIIRPKRLHVSPFQDIVGDYSFRFDIGAGRIAIAIEHQREGGGMIATLAGDLAPLSGGALAKLLFRRPFGALRVSALIRWQALKLALKGVPFRRRPPPPTEKVTG